MLNSPSSAISILKSLIVKLTAFHIAAVAVIEAFAVIHYYGYKPLIF